MPSQYANEARQRIARLVGLNPQRVFLPLGSSLADNGIRGGEVIGQCENYRSLVVVSGLPVQDS